jgi:hypothetical protein
MGENDLEYFLRFEQLLKLEDNWNKGEGKKYDRELLTKFATLFNLKFDRNLPQPGIFPKVDGSIQLEWKVESKNIIAEIELERMVTNILCFHDLNDNEELEIIISLADNQGWKSFNSYIRNYLTPSL